MPPKKGNKKAQSGRRGKSKGTVTTPLNPEEPRITQDEEDIFMTQRPEIDETPFKEPADKTAVQQQKESAPQPNNSKKKNIKYTPRIVLSRQQEDDVMNWYRDNPSFWDLRHQDYMKTRTRDQKFHDKAQELDIEDLTGPRLKTIIDSWRTRYGKITKTPPSGSGSINLTERDKWIKSMFDPILQSRVYRKRSRPVKEDLIHKLESRFPERFPMQQEAQQDDTEESQVGDSQVGDTLEDEGESTCSSIPMEQLPKVQSSSRVRKQGNDTYQVLEQIKGILEHQNTLHQQLATMSASRSPISKERRAYAHWFEACLENIHPELFSEFQSNILHVVDKFKTSSKRLYEIDCRNQHEKQASQLAPPTTSDDFRTALSIASLQQKQCPNGTLPQWQTQFQSKTLHSMHSRLGQTTQRMSTTAPCASTVSSSGSTPAITQANIPGVLSTESLTKQNSQDEMDSTVVLSSQSPESLTTFHL